MASGGQDGLGLHRGRARFMLTADNQIYHANSHIGRQFFGEQPAGLRLLAVGGHLEAGGSHPSLPRGGETRPRHRVRGRVHTVR